MSEDDAPPNSILTEQQRKFLRMSEEERREEYSRTLRSYYRREILYRFRQAFEDVGLIVHHMDADLRAKVWQEDPPLDELQDVSEEEAENLANSVGADVSDVADSWATTKLHHLLSDFIALAYLVLSDRDVGAEELRKHVLTTVGLGIETGAIRNGEPVTDVNVNYEVDTWDPKSRAAEGDSVGLYELSQLAQSGHISEEEYHEAIDIMGGLGTVLDTGPERDVPLHHFDAFSESEDED